MSGDHLWVPTSVSGDCCYVGDSDCTVSSLTPQLIPKTAIHSPSRQHEIQISIRTSLLRVLFFGVLPELVAIEKLFTTMLKGFEARAAHRIFLEKLVHKSDFSITPEKRLVPHRQPFIKTT